MDYNAIVQLVYNARKIAKDKRLRKIIAEKNHLDYVTAVDTKISNYIKSGLYQIAPTVAFVTEEESRHVSSGERFVLDPIDGTTNLIRNYNQFSIALGYYKNGQVEFGIVLSLTSDELYFAIKGKGAHLYSTKNGIAGLLKVGVENYRKNKLKVSNLDYSHAIVEFGAGSTNKGVLDESFAIAKQVFKDCADLRRICSSALALCYIASGKIDGYFERKLKVWDYCGASFILQEAGGKLSQWNGQPLTYDQPSTIVAGNKDTYDYLLKLLAHN